MGEGLDAESTLYSASLIWCGKSEGTTRIILFSFLVIDWKIDLQPEIDFACILSSTVVF